MTYVSLNLVVEYLAMLKDRSDLPIEEIKDSAVQILLAHIDDYRVRHLTEQIMRKTQ